MAVSKFRAPSVGSDAYWKMSNADRLQTMMSQGSRGSLNVSGWNNEFLPGYRNSLKTDQEKNAYDEAVKIVAGNRKALRHAAPAATLAGGANWTDFDDFHAVRSQTEKLLGRSGAVSGFGGAAFDGDTNVRTEERPLGAAEEFARQNRRVDTSGVGARVAGGSGSGSLLVGGDSEREHLALELLRAQVDAAKRKNSNDVFADLERSKFGPGTFGGEQRMRGLADLKRSIGYDDALSDAAAQSSAYWRFGEPIDRHKASEGEKLKETQFGRDAELAQIKGEAATWDDVIRAAAAAGRDTTQLQIARERALMSGANNAEQYGNTDRRNAMQGEFDRRVAGPAPAPASALAGRVGGAGPGASPNVASSPTPPANPHEGARWRDPSDGALLRWQTNGPDGPGWYEE